MTTDTIKRFQSDIAEHAMTIIRNDGVYRHIRFAKPGTSCMHFDLITWPGYLCYTGDMGTYVFTRLRDMFEFFRRSDSDKKYSIDMRYWGEKVEAADKCGGIKKFSPEKFKARIKEWIDDHEESRKPDPDDFDEESPSSSDDPRCHARAYAELRAAVQDEVIHCADDGDVRAFDAANDFRHDGDLWRVFHGEKSQFEFSDFWEVDATEFTHRFVWCCYALAWGIEQFDRATAPVAEVSA
jgi:hypothetical protein